MRRLGFVLVGIGVFLLVLAPMLRFYAYPRLAVVPLDQFTTSVSEGPGSTIFDVAQLAERDTDLTSTRTIRGDVEASTDDIAVWDTFVNSTDSDGTTVSAYTERIAFDRNTGAAVPGYGENYDGDPIEHSGQAFKFPFGTDKRDYVFWDNAVKAGIPIAYQDEDEIDGLAVYRFEQTIEPTVVSQLEVPGSLAGVDEPSITADRVYRNVRTLWIEPETGVIIRGAEQQDSTLQYDGEDFLTVTRSDIAYNDETVAGNVDEYGGLSSQLKLVRSTLPIVALVAGLALVAIGIVLVLRSGTRRETRQPATVA